MEPLIHGPGDTLSRPAVSPGPPMPYTPGTLRVDPTRPRPQGDHTMTRSILFVAIFGLLLALPPIVALSAATEQTTALGEELALDRATPIATILAEPDRLAGERVQVAGRVTGVCAAKGCWMDVTDAAGRTIQVKVEDDGPLVFPMNAMGGDAVVEGLVEVLPMEREAYIAHQRHMADDAGEEFDEASVGDGPYRIVRLRGLGAEVTPPTGP